jgi:hypothetical protein
MAFLLLIHLILNRYAAINLNEKYILFQWILMVPALIYNSMFIGPHACKFLRLFGFPSGRNVTEFNKFHFLKKN